MNCPFCVTPLDEPRDGGVTVDLVVCPSCLNSLVLRRTDGRGDWQTHRVEGLPDFRGVVGPGSVMEGLFRDLKKEMDRLPVLPEIPRRVMTLLHDPLSSLSEVADLVSQDSTLALRILKVANSAFYAGPQEIKEIHTACTRLGMRTIGNLVFAAGTANIYKMHDPHVAHMIHQLWSHALATAHCAQQLRNKVEDENRASLFLAGLLHDIGKAVLLDLIIVTYPGRTGRLRADHELLIRILDQFHALVGLLVGQYWDLPCEVRAAILFHDNVELIPEASWLRTVHAVSIANTFAHLMGYAVGGKQEQLIDSPSISYFRLNAAEVKNLFTAAHDQVENLLLAMPLE